jgi:hypothetical protein
MVETKAFAMDELRVRDSSLRRRLLAMAKEASPHDLLVLSRLVHFDSKRRLGSGAWYRREAGVTASCGHLERPTRCERG